VSFFENACCESDLVLQLKPEAGLAMQGPLDALLLRRSLRLDVQEDFAPCYRRHRKMLGGVQGILCWRSIAAGEFRASEPVKPYL